MKPVARALLVLGGVGIGVLLASAMQVRAQDKFAANVKEQIIKAAQGWDFAPALHSGALKPETNTTVSFHLEAGTRYRIIGRCDVDCSDLDLRLFDPASREVDSDVKDDDFPEVEVMPLEDGEYTVRVFMVACKSGPCRFGVGALLRD
jgi:hypothetical protein